MYESAPEPCFCCKETGKQGISIAGCFLCHDCEHVLLKAEPGEEGYDRLVACCKAIWTGLPSIKC